MRRLLFRTRRRLARSRDQARVAARLCRSASTARRWLARPGAAASPAVAVAAGSGPSSRNSAQSAPFLPAQQQHATLIVLADAASPRPTRGRSGTGSGPGCRWSPSSGSVACAPPFTPSLPQFSRVAEGRNAWHTMANLWRLAPTRCPALTTHATFGDILRDSDYSVVADHHAAGVPTTLPAAGDRRQVTVRSCLPIVHANAGAGGRDGVGTGA